MITPDFLFTTEINLFMKQAGALKCGSMVFEVVAGFYADPHNTP